MVEKTSNHGLNKYEQGETNWTHAPDMQAIEERLVVRDVEANLGAYVPHSTATFIATDTGTVFDGDGESWTAATRALEQVGASRIRTDTATFSDVLTVEPDAVGIEILGTVTSSEYLEKNYRVRTHEGIAYCCGGFNDGPPCQVTTVDLRDPTDPVILGSVDVGVAEMSHNLIVDGDLVYLGSASDSRGTGTVSVVDVSNPSDPTLRGQFQTEDHGNMGAVAMGDHYFFWRSGHISVVDISDPDDLGRINHQSGVHVSHPGELRKGYLYATEEHAGAGYHTHDGGAGDEQEMTVLDLSDPRDITVAGRTTSIEGDNTHNLTLDGTVAYVVQHHENGVVAVDIRDPTSPSVISRVQDWSDLQLPHDVTKYGDWLIVSCKGSHHDDEPGSITIVDASDPTDMTVAGTFKDPILSGINNIDITNQGFMVASPQDHDVHVNLSIPSVFFPHLSAGSVHGRDLHAKEAKIDHVRGHSAQARRGSYEHLSAGKVLSPPAHGTEADLPAGQEPAIAWVEDEQRYYQYTDSEGWEPLT